MVSQATHPVPDSESGNTGSVSVAQLLARYGQPQTAPGAAARDTSAPVPPSGQAGRPSHARYRNGKVIALAAGGALLVGTLVVGAVTMITSETGSDGQQRAEPTSRGPEHISVGGPAVADVLRSDALHPSATVLPPPLGVDVSLPTAAETRPAPKPRAVHRADPAERDRSGASPARPGPGEAPKTTSAPPNGDNRPLGPVLHPIDDLLPGP